MYVVTPGQQKGGVGKTTVTANLAAISGDFGLKVLAVDLDPQSHLTFSFNRLARPGYSLGEMLNSTVPAPPTFEEVVIRDVAPNVDLLPGDERALVSAEHDIALDPLTGMRRLRRLLDSVGDQYQLCFIDTPPKVEGLAVVALVASDGVVIVAEPQTLSYTSTMVYAAKIAQVQDSLNPNLQVLGVLLNKAFDGEESTFIQEQLRASGLHVFDTTIPVNKLASKAAAGGVPTALAHRNYEIGKIYRRAADEISDRLTATFADTDKLQEAGSR